MSEIQQEAVITKRVLERVPADKLGWKPHPKSMSLGQLALHVATIPGNLSKLAQVEEFDASAANFDPPVPNNAKEILSALDASVKAAEEYVGGVSESAVMGKWRLTSKGKEVFTIPRVGLLRTIMLNHWYHHLSWAALLAQVAVQAAGLPGSGRRLFEPGRTVEPSFL